LDLGKSNNKRIGVVAHCNRVSQIRMVLHHLLDDFLYFIINWDE